MSMWTEEEIKILREEYATTHTKVLAHKLGRSSTAVQNKASDLGIQHNSKKDLFKWTNSALEKLHAGYGVVPTDELAKDIGVSPASLLSKANNLGMKMTKEQKRALYGKKKKTMFEKGTSCANMVSKENAGSQINPWLTRAW